MKYRYFLAFLVFITLSTIYFAQKYTLLVVNDKQQTRVFFLEDARTIQQRAKGLMFRTELNRHRGMFFIYTKDSHDAYWMKNMKIPLDIVFLDRSMEIITIHRNVQPCQQDPCQRYSSTQPFRYVIELPANTTESWNTQTTQIFKIL